MELRRLRRSSRHANGRCRTGESDENTAPSPTAVASANRVGRPKTTLRPKTRHIVLSPRNSWSRAPLTRLDRNSARVHGAAPAPAPAPASAAVLSPRADVSAVAPVSPDISVPTHLHQNEHVERVKGRTSVRVPVHKANDLVGVLESARVNAVHQVTPQKLPTTLAEGSGRTMQSLSTETHLPHASENAASSTIPLNRDLGPVFDALSAHDDTLAAAQHDVATPSTKNLTNYTLPNRLEQGEQPVLPKAAAVPLWRPTNMATEEEDEITPVHNPVHKPRHQTVSSQRSGHGLQQQATQPVLTPSQPAALWRPTNMATEDEDEIVPVISNTPRAAAAPFQVAPSVGPKMTVLSSSKMHIVFDENLSSDMTKSKNTKPSSTRHLSLPSPLPPRDPLSGSPMSVSLREPGLLPLSSSKSGSQLGLEQPQRKYLMTHDNEGTNRAISEAMEIPLRNGRRSRANGVASGVITRNSKNEARKRTHGTLADDSEGDKSKPATFVYSARTRRRFRRGFSPTHSHVSISSESESDKDLEKRDDVVIAEIERPKGSEDHQLGAIIAMGLDPENRKRCTVQTYSKRQRTQRSDGKKRKLLLPSRRALGVHSASPSSEEKAVHEDMSYGNGNESTSINWGDEGHNRSEMIRKDEIHGEEVMDDLLKTFYIAQRQLWKEVDEISLEEEFD